jgi:hypothetical protein
MTAPAGARWAGQGGSGLALLPWRVRSLYRSAYPADTNDGLLWGGRGLSAGTTAGVDLTVGPLVIAVSPEVVWSQNRAFALPETKPGWSPWADPWSTPGADHYLRAGVGADGRVGPGDSFVELNAASLRAGVSTERLWWGPARRYALLFSGTAQGFPHAFLETSRPLSLGPGAISAGAFVGRLEESSWFDADESNDRRRISAGRMAWEVGFVPGLELAAFAVRHEPWERGSGTGEATHLGTVAARMALPDEGIEVYAEVGRGDLFVNGTAGVSDRRYAQVYMMGFSRADTTAGGTAWRLWGELVKQAMELPQPRSGTPDSAYVGPPVPQGHTHGGQFLGTWTGPGSNAQAMGLDFPGLRGAWGVFAERVRRDDDTYYRVHHRDYGFRGHDLEWTLGARGTRDVGLGAAGILRAHLESGVSRRKNRSFVGLDGGRNWSFVREWNARADLVLTWYPR